MTKPIKIILNPYAGRWKAQAQIEPLKAVLTRLGISFDLSVTQKSGEGTALAKRAVEEGFAVVVAAGGDSTISEVMNGIVQASGDNLAGTLGVIPLGSANDLAFGLDIPLDLTEACQRLLNGNTRVIDVCQVNDRYFDNNSAMGLEPTVTLEAENIARIKGTLRYLVAALRAIWKRPSWYAHLKWDDGEYKGAIALVSVGNGPRTGGFFMTPNAKFDDGKLDFIFAPAMGRWKLLNLLPKTLNGSHIHHPDVTYIQATYLNIETDTSPFHADGEIVSRRVKKLKYRIIPQKLRIIV